GLLAGAGGVLSMAGDGGTGGTAVTRPPCGQPPTVNNDPACPDPGVLSWGRRYVESACADDLRCDFLMLTGNDPCTQPPIAQSFQCCGWGFASTCPTLPEGQDPSCVLPIDQNTPCTVEGLACQVLEYEGSPATDYVCCDGLYRLGSGC
ncbi:MAG TPA: hypothetical protein VFV94_16980, partial [Polyangiaceae bacterium]|nr:hypothetical protein [Polyangiaceae bacterium]